MIIIMFQSKHTTIINVNMDVRKLKIRDTYFSKSKILGAMFSTISNKKQVKSSLVNHRQTHR